jgi:ribosomal protein L31
MIFFLLCLIRIVFIRLAVQQKLFVIYIYIKQKETCHPLYTKGQKREIENLELQ